MRLRQKDGSCCHKSNSINEALSSSLHIHEHPTTVNAGMRQDQVTKAAGRGRCFFSSHRFGQNAPASGAGHQFESFRSSEGLSVVLSGAEQALPQRF